MKEIIILKIMLGSPTRFIKLENLTRAFRWSSNIGQSNCF